MCLLCLSKSKSVPFWIIIIIKIKGAVTNFQIKHKMRLITQQTIKYLQAWTSEFNPPEPTWKWGKQCCASVTIPMLEECGRFPRVVGQSVQPINEFQNIFGRQKWRRTSSIHLWPSQTCAHTWTHTCNIHHQESKKMHKGLRKIYPFIFHLKMANINMLAFIFLGFKKVNSFMRKCHWHVETIL